MDDIIILIDDTPRVRPPGSIDVSFTIGPAVSSVTCRIIGDGIDLETDCTPPANTSK